MSHNVSCYRCGASLAHLSLPLSRQDACPACSVHLHVCRMCRNYAPTAVDQCVEDDAERVVDKERLNFCDWFVAAEGAFDAAARREEEAAKAALNSLFGDGSAAGDANDDPERAAAEALFGKDDE